MDAQKRKSFNENQLKAIAHTVGPAMVIAGPGSGKTTVITNRIAALIAAGTARPSEILVITFTVSAAREMRDRYLKLAGSSDISPESTADHSRVTFGTFHSVFYSFLRKYPFFQRVRIAETNESISILRAAVSARYPDLKFTSDYYAYLLNEISRIKNGAFSGAEAHGGSSFKELTAAQQMALDIREDFGRRMLRAGLIDFDDMLTLCERFLRSDARLLSFLRQRFRFIMVDEFQDINPIQFETVKLLAAPANNLFVVGDDDQSIYAFRGSEPGIMLSFNKYYPDAAFYELFTNYRSTPQIIRKAAGLIGKNKDRYKKQFNTVREKHEPVMLHSFSDAKAEAEWIINDIQRLPADYKTVGILYRTHRAGSSVVRKLDAVSKVCDEHSQAYTKAPFEDRTITPMSFHASKGLEFDVVYIVSANEGITPSKSAGEENIEEERRLFYVAMTRAKYFLHISNTKYIYNKEQKMSRFVREAIGAAVLLPRR